MSKREIVQNKASNIALQNNYNGILNISPRVGKSKIIIDALNNDNDIFSSKNIVITAPYTDILDSWKVELEKWNCKYAPKLTTNKSLNKQKHIDVLIVDECQELSPKNIEFIKDSKISNIILMSGTISDKTYEALSCLNRQLIFEYTIDEAIEDGIVNDYRIVLQGLSLGHSKYIPKKDGKLASETENYRYLDGMFNKFRSLEWRSSGADRIKFKAIKNNMANKRMNAIYNYNTKYLVTSHLLKSITQPTIVYTARKEIAERLGNAYTSDNKDDSVLIDFKEGRIPYVTAIGKLSMGVSFPEVSNIIMSQINSNEEVAIQKAMRAGMVIGGKETSTITILYYKNTQDEVWVNKAIQGFNESKITRI